ncbi:hypothetical protein [Dysgonomonas sp. ZJ279]|uniref:hypothetical protein n=1 Tax=Dysgonomonas sp. ZJ279 TaxID=2709796 RepID=UPI0013ED346B|nr:hypothetical protein [Dysgonomonas sp. ZJ279]
MKKHIKFIILVLATFCSHLLFAGPPKSIKNAFRCFENKDTKISERINIEGFYGGHFFYENGLYARSSIIWSDPEQDINDRVNYDHVLALQKAMDNRTKNELRDFYRWEAWGNYKIEGDIIKTQSMENTAPLSAFNGAFETWFRIIDRNTISYLGRIRIGEDEAEKQKLEEEMSKSKGERTIIFTPTPIPPYQKAWILKEKWFWCNKNDRKIFMEKIKNEK